MVHAAADDGEVGWEIELARLPWAVLSALLELSPDGRPVPVDDLETAVGREWSDTSLRPVISRLNLSLEQIGWPWDYGVRVGYIVRN